jgi:hypothetical protein
MQWRKLSISAAVTMAAAAVFVLAPVAAQAKVLEGTPELYDNGNVVGPTGIPMVSHGEVTLTSPGLFETHCVWMGFEEGWNEGGRAHGQILSWITAGHSGSGAGSHGGVSCEGDATFPAWFVAELPVQPAGHRAESSPTTPWKTVGLCGEREEETVAITQIGYPTSEEPAAHGCKTEAEEELEMKHEREHTGAGGCYNHENPVEPKGCINMTFLEPELALEIAFEGSLRPQFINGVKNGLSASRWHFTGGKSNELVCEDAQGPETQGKCPVSLNLKGYVETLGMAASELMQTK